jgi:hypothetical protein
MKSRLLKRAALLAGLMGFVWSFVAIDPVVRTDRSISDLTKSGNKSPLDGNHRSAKNILVRR